LLKIVQGAARGVDWLEAEHDVLVARLGNVVQAEDAQEAFGWLPVFGVVEWDGPFMRSGPHPLFWNSSGGPKGPRALETLGSSIAYRLSADCTQ
jgi:hypothetical protein